VNPDRTVTESYVALYTSLSGEDDPLHTDEEYYRNQSIYCTRVAPGPLGLAIADGLRFRTGSHEPPVVDGLEWRWRFIAPIKIGDTLRISWEIVRKRETSKADRGILCEAVQLLNQRHEVVAEGEPRRLVRKRVSM
jgi:acyl dehydratase